MRGEHLKIAKLYGKWNIVDYIENIFQVKGVPIMKGYLGGLKRLNEYDKPP